MKPILNEEILFRFLMDTAAEVQLAASKREPGMKIIIFAFHSEDFDNFLIKKSIDLGKNKRNRLKIINIFIAKHYESNRIWMREEDTVNLNNYYFFQM